MVVGRKPEGVQTAIETLGGAAVGFAGDAADSSTSVRAIERCRAEHGSFHGLYHVAGGSGRKFGDGPLHAIPDEGWDATMRLNLDALFYSNRAAVNALLEIGHGGSILNMGSVLGFSPSPQFFSTHAYAAAKGAVIGLSRAAAAQYAPQGIRINVIAPALVATPMSRRAQENEEILQFIKSKQPLDGGRIGLPEDLDAAVVWLLGDDSKFVTGQVIAVDGGWSVRG